MSTLYRHTQRGTALVAASVLSAVIVVIALALVGLQAPSAVSWAVIFALMPVFALLAGVAWYFSSMTIEVTQDELRWRFGLGGDRKVARADIASVAVEPHPLLWGHGIRWGGPGRWVYIVAGRETVEVRLKSGGWRRLGTDDPQGLIAALTTSHN